ncbi:mitochondrial inner membrane protein OXA1L-like [Chrysoperla carnea]|uniref:mitochondrial inner membrane protein OXA1L-like n=2 Tax=Chrysoperla carnea TaxID=189513 RepID=UPI001D08986D|nr:mitochondrial inner membrane protein OXA1L-like [Chrysoperla carnea]
MFSRTYMFKKLDKFIRIKQHKLYTVQICQHKIHNGNTSISSNSTEHQLSIDSKKTVKNKFLTPIYHNGLVSNINNRTRNHVLNSVCYMSTVSTNNAADILKSISSLPEIPKPPTVSTNETTADLLEATTNLTTQTIDALKEPSFESLGLGGWTPVGMVQQCLEYLHIGLDVPWWLTIVIGTMCVRILIFPLVIIAQRNAAIMNNHMPRLQELQVKMSEARQSGNNLDAARYGQEMMVFMKEKKLNPLKNMLVPLAQAPLFISFFMGLRGMANVPVDSMRYGGLFWFTDLTLPDPFYILPVITSFTMWVTIEVGTDAARLSSQNLQTMRYVLRALPVIIIPFTINFPGAILCYWVSTNFISLLQVGFLRIPSVRSYFNIDPLVTHNPENLPVKPKPFVEGMKESWRNMKIAKELEERERFDDMQFQRAGRGPIIKTYKFDPTKVSGPPVTPPTKK